MEHSSLYQKIRNSLTLKLIFIAFLLLLLHIPVLMLYGLIRERTEALKKNEQELGKGWGQSQIVSGLYLAIPREKEINGKKITEILSERRAPCSPPVRRILPEFI